MAWLVGQSMGSFVSFQPALGPQCDMAEYVLVLLASRSPVGLHQVVRGHRTEAFGCLDNGHGMSPSGFIDAQVKK